jgi:hypothetical protein
MKSRMKGDFHVRFCGKVEVRFPLTRLWGIPTQDPSDKQILGHMLKFN